MTMTKPEIDPEFLFSQEYADDPYPTLKLLRDHYPVYHNPVTDHWMISRYDDVCAAFRDLENYSAQPNALGIGAVFGPTLMEYDGEQHNKLRNIVAPEFVGKKLEALLPDDRAELDGAHREVHGEARPPHRRGGGEDGAASTSSTTSPRACP